MRLAVSMLFEYVCWFEKLFASACLAERARPSVQGFHLMQMHRRSADPRRDSESPLKHPHPKHTCTYIYIYYMHFSKILTSWNPCQTSRLLTCTFFEPWSCLWFIMHSWSFWCTSLLFWRYIDQSWSFFFHLQHFFSCVDSFLGGERRNLHMNQLKCILPYFYAHVSAVKHKNKYCYIFKNFLKNPIVSSISQSTLKYPSGNKANCDAVVGDYSGASTPFTIANNILIILLIPFIWLICVH